MLTSPCSMFRPFKDLMQKANDQGRHGIQQQSPHDYLSSSKYPCASLTPELPRLSPFAKRRYLNGSASPNFLQSPTIPSMPVRSSVAKYEAGSSPYSVQAVHYHRQLGGGYFQYGNSPQRRAQQLPLCEGGMDNHGPGRRATVVASDEMPSSSSSKFILPSPTVSMSRRESLTDSFDGVASIPNGTTVYGKGYNVECGDFNTFPMTPMTEISETSTVVDVQPYTMNGHHGRNSTGPMDSYMDEQIGVSNGSNYRNGTSTQATTQRLQSQQQQQRSSHPQQQPQHRYYATGNGSIRTNGDTAMTKLERRRKAHLDSEKRRRGNIKNGMDELMGLIPGCSSTSSELAQQDGKANSKAIILRKAKDYIIQLMKKIEEIERERNRIESEYHSEKASKEHFQRENDRFLTHLQQCSGHHDYRCTL